MSRDQPLADHLAVAEHGVAVGDAEDLVELVADEEDRLALGLQLRDDAEQLVDLVVRQRGGRLVHDDDAGIDATARGRSRRGACCAMPRSRSRMSGIDRRVDALQQRCAPARFIARQSISAEPVARLVAHEDVLGHRQFVEHHGFLVDRGDAAPAPRPGRRRKCTASPSTRISPASGW